MTKAGVDGWQKFSWWLYDGMTMLPIVGREMRVASRRAATYWSRVAAGGASILGFVGVMLVMALTRQGSPQATGEALFYTLVWLDFAFCLVIGIQLTSDCVSEEKREGTLGFLFLTDLKGYDVILGKLSATSLTAGYAMLTSLPVLAVTMLLGGVSPLQVAQAALMLANTLVFSLSAGIVVSTFCRNARTAAALTFLVIFLVCCAIPIGGFLWMLAHNQGVMKVTPSFQATLAMSPICACVVLASPAKVPWMFWLSCKFVLAMNCVFLFAAARIVRGTWQDRPASARWQRWREWWFKWLQGNREARHAFRRRLLEVNAVLWLTSRNRLKVVYMWIYCAMAIVFWFWGFSQVPNWINFDMAVGFCFVNHLVLKMAVSTEAGERYGLDLQSGALELLLSTRMSVTDFLRGQMLALKRHFFRPALAILAFDLVLLALAWWGGNDHPFTKTNLGWTMIAGMVVLAADLVALTWMGMWTGLTSKDVKKASSTALALVLLPPWLAVFVLNAVDKLFLDGMEVPLAWKLWLWVGISLATDYFFGRRAYARLQAEFRSMAMRRYDPAPAPSGWRRLVWISREARRWFFTPDKA